MIISACTTVGHIRCELTRSQASGMSSGTRYSQSRATQPSTLPSSNAPYSAVSQGSRYPEVHLINNADSSHSSEGLGSETGRLCHLGRTVDLRFLVFLATPHAACPKTNYTFPPPLFFGFFLETYEPRRGSSCFHASMDLCLLVRVKISTSGRQGLFSRQLPPSSDRWYQKFALLVTRARQYPTWFCSDTMYCLETWMSRSQIPGTYRRQSGGPRTSSYTGMCQGGPAVTAFTVLFRFSLACSVEHGDQKPAASKPMLYGG